MNGQVELEVDFKRKYKNLKRKLKFLVYVSTLILPNNVQCIPIDRHLRAPYSPACSFSRSKNASRRSSGEHRGNFSKFPGTKGEYTLQYCGKMCVKEYYLLAANVSFLIFFCKAFSWTDFCSMRGWMKTPQVTTVLFLNSDQRYIIRYHII